MAQPIVRTDRSAFERVRDAILNRGNPDNGQEQTGPGAPTSG
jgi:hypothetical protein